MGPKKHGCHLAASGHLPPPGIRGKVTLKGRRTGLRRLKDKGAGRDWGLRSGAGSPESQDRGENAASPGAGRPARPPGPEKERLKNVERINHLA